MSIINNICEHGHLQRKCEVCDLRAEIARLRSVCRKCSGVLMRQYDKMTLEQVQQLPWLSSAIVTVAQDMGACGDGVAGKEPIDGE